MSHKNHDFNAPDDHQKLQELRCAVRELIDNVKSRYPDQDLYCPYMRKLDELTSSDEMLQ